MEPFFFSSSINWIPSRYQVCIVSPILTAAPSFRIIEGESYPQKGRPCVYQLIRKPHCRPQPLCIIDITVTLTFIRIMDQSKPINPSNQSTLIEPKQLLARLKSLFSFFSWWSYFTNQIEEVGNIDTLAPLFLHSSMTGGPTRGLS